MFLIQNTLVSLDVLEKEFCCDLDKCRGCCCIEGDAGAPLEKREINILKKIYPEVKPYMEEKGIAEVRKTEYQLWISTMNHVHLLLMEGSAYICVGTMAWQCVP